MTTVIVANFAVGLAVIVLPLRIAFHRYLLGQLLFPDTSNLSSSALLSRDAHVGRLLAVMNSADASVALSFGVVAVTLLAHRLLWPAISRPVYFLQRIRIAERNKVLRTTGLVQVGYGISLFLPIVHSLIPRLFPK
jgi:hypothetical protein